MDEDTARAGRAEALQREGELLLAHQGGVVEPGGWVTVTDWYADPPSERRLAVDVRLGLVGSAEQRFRAARRLRRAGEVAAQRRIVTLQQLATWRERLQRVGAADDLQAIRALERAFGLEPASDGPASEPGRAGTTSPRKAWRVVTGTTGRDILVGRGGRDNEELTFRRAGPHDLWLHVRGAPGAHVVVPMRRDEVPSSDLLLDAATLAAYYSSMRGEARVEVQYTRRKYVRAVPGGPPGRVRLERERTLLLHVDAERLARLLCREGQAHDE